MTPFSLPLTRQPVHVPRDLAPHDALTVVLLLQAVLLADDGMLAQRSRWEAYSVMRGIVHGGRN